MSKSYKKINRMFQCFQVVVWDNRVQKRTPVQRSPLSAAAHTHPVFCMRVILFFQKIIMIINNFLNILFIKKFQVVGTPNAHNLISISTDGRLCSWSLDMLSQPQETLELQQHKQSKVCRFLYFSIALLLNFENFTLQVVELRNMKL